MVLPEMSEFFHTSPTLASLSLTTGMIGLAIGQVFIGPLTDKFGRKKILVGSMLMFAIASVLCILASNIYIFNLMRLFQGLAGAGSIVMIVGALLCHLLTLPLCKMLRGQEKKI